jgi:hypothetical protein
MKQQIAHLEEKRFNLLSLSKTPSGKTASTAKAKRMLNEAEELAIQIRVLNRAK